MASVLAPDGSWFVNIKEHCDDGQRSLYVKDLTIAHARRWGWRFVDEFCWRNTRNGTPGVWPNRFKNAFEPTFHFSKSSDIRFRPIAVSAQSELSFTYDKANGTSKTNGILLGKHAVGERGLARPSNVLDIAPSSDSLHGAAFPVALPAFFIKAFSDPGDTIMDPFCGSGTTIVAAHKEGRRGFGVELSPAYCAVILERLSALGLEPRLT